MFPGFEQPPPNMSEPFLKVEVVCFRDHVSFPESAVNGIASSL